MIFFLKAPDIAYMLITPKISTTGSTDQLKQQIFIESGRRISRPRRCHRRAAGHQRLARPTTTSSDDDFQKEQDVPTANEQQQQHVPLPSRDYLPCPLFLHGFSCFGCYNARPPNYYSTNDEITRQYQHYLQNVIGTSYHGHIRTAKLLKTRKVGNIK